MSFSIFPNNLFPPVLPPNRLVGGGPAGVVDGLLNEKPDGAGVVEPVGADEVEPPVGTLPALPFTSPGFKRDPPPNVKLGGVCEAPVPPKGSVFEAPPKPPNPPLGLLSAAAPFDVFLSAALEAPKPAKPNPFPVDLPASPLPNILLPVDCPAPKRLLPDVPVGLNFGGSLAMAITARVFNN